MSALRLLELLHDRAVCVKTQLDLLEYELDALIDPLALEHAALAGASLTHLTERLDELLADQKEAVA